MILKYSLSMLLLSVAVIEEHSVSVDSTIPKIESSRLVSTRHGDFMTFNYPPQHYLKGVQVPLCRLDYSRGRVVQTRHLLPMLPFYTSNFWQAEYVTTLDD